MFHQTPDKWEVADVYTVEPVRIYLEDDGQSPKPPSFSLLIDHCL